MAKRNRKWTQHGSALPNGLSVVFIGFSWVVPIFSPGFAWYRIVGLELPTPFGSTWTTVSVAPPPFWRCLTWRSPQPNVATLAIFAGSNPCDIIWTMSICTFFLGGGDICDIN